MMQFNYVVNNRFDNEDHYICFPHFFRAFLYALRIRSKVERIEQ